MDTGRFPRRIGKPAVLRVCLDGRLSGQDTAHLVHETEPLVGDDVGLRGHRLDDRPCRLHHILRAKADQRVERQRVFGCTFRNLVGERLFALPLLGHLRLLSADARP